MQTFPVGVLRRTLAAFRLMCAAAPVAIFLAVPAAGQSFPSRPITIVVGYAAGGQADVLARRVGQRLNEILKTPVVVENRPGGNTLIASQAVAKAAPDGHTLLLVTDGMTTIDPQVQGGSGFDPAQAFELVINMTAAPLFLAAKKDLPADTLPALIAFGKKNPTELTFGTSGPTTPHRIAGEMLKQRGGFAMMHVAYKGTAASVNDLAGGHIPLVIGASAALVPLVESGKIKLLAVTSEKRFPLLPDVPAISETLPGFNLVSYLGLAVTKGTPADVVTKLNEAVNAALSTPDVRDYLQKQGMILAGGSAADFKAQIAADYQARGRIIRDLNIAAE
jgi:tripartite-type tricarboxylate transporter receptor subunit TctC